ncbi:metalloregulator ArsR/SmtB family transcription factor [Devosia sp. A8/3-2]|nr:metalloregulator ArsR/SmtB family transcription factor [Devosia sp. A8/3-2]
MAPVPIFIALADPTRCRIIELLRAGPSPVHRLAAEFDISRPAISRHLRVLREAGLIREEKSGRENLYALQVKRLAPVRKWLDKLAPAPVSAEKPRPLRSPSPRRHSFLIRW